MRENLAAQKYLRLQYILDCSEYLHTGRFNTYNNATCWDAKDLI